MTSNWLGVAALLTTSLIAPASRGSSSAGELVRQARAHEAAHENDVAARRYMEALSIESTNSEAWMGLGALRMNMGDAAEAERVYSAAIDRVPSLHAALEARALSRWSLGRRGEAELDLEAFAALEDSLVALRELATWYGIDGRAPAQLAIWRRVLALSVDKIDNDSAREAQRMVRALVILVDGADPVSSPIEPNATRRALAAICKRGG